MWGLRNLHGIIRSFCLGIIRYTQSYYQVTSSIMASNLCVAIIILSPLCYVLPVLYNVYYLVCIIIQSRIVNRHSVRRAQSCGSTGGPFYSGSIAFPVVIISIYGAIHTPIHTIDANCRFPATVKWVGVN